MPSLAAHGGNCDGDTRRRWSTSCLRVKSVLLPLISLAEVSEASDRQAARVEARDSRGRTIVVSKQSSVTAAVNVVAGWLAGWQPKYHLVAVVEARFESRNSRSACFLLLAASQPRSTATACSSRYLVPPRPHLGPSIFSILQVFYVLP